MAKLTLLEMTQKILSSMDSDDVNSISDTEESLQVVDLIVDTYEFMMIELDPPHLNQTCQLENLGDATRPTVLVIPESVTDINKLKYEVTEDDDSDRTFTDLTYCEPQDFVDMLLKRSTSADNITETESPSGTPLFVYNDRFPKYWTSFDDTTVTADAYDNTESNTLLGSKTVTLCKKLPDFIIKDTFIPDMPDKLFPLFLSESRRSCHLFLKQQDSKVDAKRTLQGTHTYRQKNWRAHDSKRKINFGRK